RLHCNGKFIRARNANDRDVIGIAVMPHDAIDGGLGKPFGDQTVEARHDDPELRSLFDDKVTFDNFRHDSLIFIVECADFIMEMPINYGGFELREANSLIILRVSATLLRETLLL